MDGLFHFTQAEKRDGAVDAWLRERPDELGTIAQHWFEVMRDCGEDVTELLHDGHPTVCVGTAAFAYVDCFTAHVNVGFYRGAELDDPAGLLTGTGRLMRHVKLRPAELPDCEALSSLIESACADMRQRIAGVPSPSLGQAVPP